MTQVFLFAFADEKHGGLSPEIHQNCGGNFGGRRVSRIEKLPHKSIGYQFNVCPLDRTILEIGGV
jgi:hypothetical protein